MHHAAIRSLNLHPLRPLNLDRLYESRRDSAFENEYPVGTEEIDDIAEQLFRLSRIVQRRQKQDDVEGLFHAREVGPVHHPIVGVGVFAPGPLDDLGVTVDSDDTTRAAAPG